MTARDVAWALGLALPFVVLCSYFIWLSNGYKSGRKATPPVRVNVVSPSWVDHHVCIACKKTLREWTKG